MAEAKEHILVVDDNPHDRALFRAILERAGYSVVEGSSGKEALATVEKARFALMTLDMSMPDFDGFEMLQALRSTHPDLKIIAVSGFMQGKMLGAARLMGADATLDKNLAMDSLSSMVCNLLKNPK